MSTKDREAQKKYNQAMRNLIDNATMANPRTVVYMPKDMGSSSLVYGFKHFSIPAKIHDKVLRDIESSYITEMT